MADVFTKQKRSWIMARVRGRNTKPELAVRSIAHRLGYRFRLGGAGLPGRPDLVFPRLKKVIFVHECFWHRHKGCRRSALPASNVGFWRKKLLRNAARDRRNFGADLSGADLNGARIAWREQERFIYLAERRKA